jgi:hypothetical protein
MNMYPVVSTATIRKLRGFGDLAQGWHYGSGGPIGGERIRDAIRVLDEMYMLGLTRTDAFPGAGGEIQLTAYHQDHYLSVILETDGTLSITHEKNGVLCCDVDGAQISAAKAILLKIAGEIWPTYAWSIPDTSILYVANLRTSHFGNQLMAVSRSSTGNVLRPQAA